MAFQDAIGLVLKVYQTTIKSCKLSIGVEFVRGRSVPVKLRSAARNQEVRFSLKNGIGQSVRQVPKVLNSDWSTIDRTALFGVALRHGKLRRDPLGKGVHRAALSAGTGKSEIMAHITDID